MSIASRWWAPFTLFLAGAGPAAAQIAEPIEIGQTVEGRIDAAAATAHSGGRYACWVIRTEKGRELTLHLKSPSIRVGWFLVAAPHCWEGKVVKGLGFAGPGDRISSQTVRIPASGQLTVSVHDDLPGAARADGAVTLAVVAAGQPLPRLDPWKSSGSASTTASTGATPAEGTQIKDCDACPALIVVPAGNFLIGSLPTDPERDGNEGPRHAVTIARPFAIGRTEVSFDEWDACVAEAGCSTLADNGWGRGRRPAINVGFDQAVKYVAWLSAKTGQRYFLPSEAEWEYAARAGTETAWTTGDGIIGDDANILGQFGKTVPVGGYPPNAFGLHDVHGNAAEWVQDCLDTGYVGAPTDGSASSAGDCGGGRILRGGGFASMPAQARSAYRGTARQRRDYGAVGFRVARAL